MRIDAKILRGDIMLPRKQYVDIGIEQFLLDEGSLK